MSSEGDTRASTRVVIVSEGIWSSLGFAPNFLRRASVRLISARTGSEALTLAGASDPVLLVLEYSLPVLRADHVCSQFLSREKHRGVPVIITGPPDPPEIQSACREAGCTLFIPTPLDVPFLLDRVAALLGVSERNLDRMRVILSVSYGAVTSDFLGQSRDLNEGGMGLTTTHPLQVGDYLNLKFFLDGDEGPIIASGQIVRAVHMEGGEFDLGIRFLNLSRNSRERLLQFLTRRRP